MKQMTVVCQEVELAQCATEDCPHFWPHDFSKECKKSDHCPDKKKVQCIEVGEG